MRPRFPGFGFALCGPLALLLGGCGGALQAGMSAKAEAPPPSPGAATSAPTAMEMGAVGGEAMQAPAPSPMTAGTTLAAPADGAAAPAPVSPEPAPAGTVARAPRADAPTPRTSGAVASSTVNVRREMLDIEANVEIRVASVKQAVKRLHALSERIGGVITAEQVNSASTYGTATLTLRVPSTATQGVFAELDQLGDVLNQSVSARDVSKEYFDATLRLSSLEATLHRYEDILSKANKVEEILRIEQELGRIRSEIEQVKGNLRWLQDRAARATLHFNLHEKAAEIAYTEEPEAKFYPGVRAPLLLDFGKVEQQTYGGGGVSLRFARALSLDLDVLKRFNSEERGPDALIASVGGEVYSSLLGDGKRRFLNPYLGWRAGYARFDQDNQAVVGATLGVELYKNDWFDLDLEARNYLAFGGSRGAHYALAPALSAGLAF